MHEVIVVGVDGSPGGYAAVAPTMGEVDEFMDEKNRYFAGVGARAVRTAGRHGVEMEHEIRAGHAADVLVRFVGEVGADLVVLGYKGHSRIARFVIGTTAQKVNAVSQASALIVKPRGRIEELWPGGGPEVSG